MKRSIRDKRVRRTRQALTGAFNGLLFERGFQGISVNDVVNRARVGRSTFYEHFRGKEAVLINSLAGPMTILADSVGSRDNTPELVRLLEHFWDQRVLARDLLTGSMGKRIRTLLSTLIEERLRMAVAPRGNCLLIPERLAAVQLAEALLAPLTAWLLGESRCSAQALAVGLRRVARACLAALAST
jgi:AcrR family transcriptional regulator